MTAGRNYLHELLLYLFTAEDTRDKETPPLPYSFLSQPEHRFSGAIKSMLWIFIAIAFAMLLGQLN